MKRHGYLVVGIIVVHGATGRIDPKADDAAEQYISRSHAFKVGGNYTAAFVTAFNAADGYVVFGFWQLYGGWRIDLALANAFGRQRADGARVAGRINRNLLIGAFGDCRTSSKQNCRQVNRLFHRIAPQNN